MATNNDRINYTGWIRCDKIFLAAAYDEIKMMTMPDIRRVFMSGSFLVLMKVGKTGWNFLLYHLPLTNCQRNAACLGRR